MARFMHRLGAAFAALALSAQMAAAVVIGPAPVYLNSAGLPTGAQGFICLNLDGSSCTFGGGGGGGGAVTAAAASYAAGYSSDLGNMSTYTACSTDNGACPLLGLVARNNQRLTSLITALGSPFQAGASIANTSFGISGNLPPFASTPTFNCGTGCGGGAPFLRDSQPAVLTLATPNTSGRIALPGAAATLRITVNTGTAQCVVGNTSVTATSADTTYFGGIRSGGIASNAQADIACISSVANTITVETGSGAAYPEIASDLTAPSKMQGDVAAGSPDSGAPVKTGGVAATAEPTAQAAGNRVNDLTDAYGRKVITPVLRGQVGTQHTTITASASETTIVTAAGPSVFADPFSIELTNTSATDGKCDIRDATAGTLRRTYAVKAGTTSGFSRDAGSAISQTTANGNWTATCTSLSSWEITVDFRKTKG